MSNTSESYPRSESSLDITNDSSLGFFYNIIQQAELADTATSSREYVNRDREKALEALNKDYFNEDSLYDDEHFRRRYRHPKRLFLEICHAIEATREPFFQEGYDARNKKGFTAIQKCLSALDQLASGDPADRLDGYLKMGVRTSRECLEYFCVMAIRLYRQEYLCRPTTHDVALLHIAHEELHHIPGMLGSIDCTHFEWKQCPTQLHRQYKRGNHKHPTIMLEAVASYDLWIWHAYFGPPDSNNDINVLNSSPLFMTERNGTAPKSPFVVNGRNYKRRYYLADGGYPNWSTFVKVYTYPTEQKEKKFKKLQESARKDVKRAFGSLKGRWGILNRPLRFMGKEKIASVVYTCIILHNMLIKEDCCAICPVHIMDPPVQPVADDTVLPELRNEETCFRLRYDLTEHVAAQYLLHLEGAEDSD